MLPDQTKSRSLDAICLGRAGLDLYAAEADTDFVDVTAFEKHVGGSPANIAVAMARLGSRVGFIGKVSDDMVGRYVRHFLQSENIDVEHLGYDATGTRTSLALTEMRAQDCGVVIYRNQAADLALSAADIDPAFIADARMLVVSGTALCAEPSRSATFAAIDAAIAADTLVVLDLDYRDYTWPSLADARATYQRAAKVSQLLIGNLEEFSVLHDLPAGDGVAEDVAAASLTNHTRCVLLKGGASGSSILRAEHEPVVQRPFDVDVQKPFGAGDAYAGAICAGLIDGLDIVDCVRRGAAAAAMVVAARSCSSASPDTAQLDNFLAHHAPVT